MCFTTLFCSSRHCECGGVIALRLIFRTAWLYGVLCYKNVCAELASISFICHRSIMMDFFLLRFAMTFARVARRESQGVVHFGQHLRISPPCRSIRFSSSAVNFPMRTMWVSVCVRVNRNEFATSGIGARTFGAVRCSTITFKMSCFIRIRNTSLFSIPFGIRSVCYWIRMSKITHITRWSNQPTHSSRRWENAVWISGINLYIVWLFGCHSIEWISVWCVRVCVVCTRNTNSSRNTLLN